MSSSSRNTPHLIVKADFLCTVAGHPVATEDEDEEEDEGVDGNEDKEDVEEDS